MNSILSGFLCFTSGSLLTLFALQLFDGTVGAGPSEQIQNKTLSHISDSSPQQSAAASAIQQSVACQSAVKAEFASRTAASVMMPDSITAAPPGIAVLEDNLYLHSVLPAVSQLSGILSLESGQQDTLNKLLQAKTTADLQNWHELQQLARQPQGDAEQLNADYQQKAQQSAQLYNEELKKVLSPQQYQNYLRYERSQAELRIQQQVQQLNNQLNKIDQLDEFQRQEIARLSSAVFAAAEEILPGTSASPYAPSPIKTNNDALEQLRSVFSESQLKQAGL